MESKSESKQSIVHDITPEVSSFEVVRGPNDGAKIVNIVFPKGLDGKEFNNCMLTVEAAREFVQDLYEEVARHTPCQCPDCMFDRGELTENDRDIMNAEIDRRIEEGEADGNAHTYTEWTGDNSIEDDDDGYYDDIDDIDDGERDPRE